MVIKMIKRITALLLITAFIVSPIQSVLVHKATAASPYIGRTFPKIHINIDMADVDKEEWSLVNVSIDNTLSQYQAHHLQAAIRGRGNSSWHNFPPPNDKRPFRLKFVQARTMLDSGHAAQNWTFLAVHSDKSIMRDYSAFHLGRQLDGMYTAPFARFVDVYFNGAYWGVYLLCVQNSEIAPGQVNLAYNADPALCEYLIERCGRNPSEGVVDVDYVTVAGVHYGIKFPDSDSRWLTPEHVQYVKNYLMQVEAATTARNNEVFKVVDIPSFADYYIVQELYKNNDVGYSSVFMQIRGQGEERRLEWGPIWDFDASAGNLANWEVYDYGPEGIWVGSANHWIRRLLEVPQVFDAVAERFHEIKYAQIENTIEHMKFMSREFNTALERNFQRWDMDRYVWHNPPEVREINTVSGQVDYLVKWLEMRIDWLGRHFKCPVCKSEPCLADCELKCVVCKNEPCLADCRLTHPLLGVISPQGIEANEPTIYCVLEVLKHIVDMPGSIENDTSGRLMRAARISDAALVEGGRPTIFCVLEILKYIVGMESRVGDGKRA